MARCPVCKISCTPVRYENVPVQTCGGCGGYWLTPLKLDRICAIREVQMPEAVRQKMMDLADASNTVEKLMCITCGVEMVREQFKIWDDIQLDRCPKCSGIWLDRGELEKCQIYWEYLQDHPEEWENQPAQERKLLIEAELRLRQAERRQQRDEVSRMQFLRWFNGF
jgi:Zn-finger nucleic acid-binding protein